MAKIKIADNTYEADKEVIDYIDQLEAHAEKVKDEVYKEVEEKTKLAKMAKDFSVEVDLNAENKEIKKKILDELKIEVPETASAEFMDGLLAGAELAKTANPPKKVLDGKTDKFDFNSLKDMEV
jgi:hypothetical protein